MFARIFGIYIPFLVYPYHIPSIHRPPSYGRSPLQTGMIDLNRTFFVNRKSGWGPGIGNMESLHRECRGKARACGRQRRACWSIRMYALCRWGRHAYIHVCIEVEMLSISLSQPFFFHFLTLLLKAMIEGMRHSVMQTWLYSLSHRLGVLSYTARQLRQSESLVTLGYLGEYCQSCQCFYECLECWL